MMLDAARLLRAPSFRQLIAKGADVNMRRMC